MSSKTKVNHGLEECIQRFKFLIRNKNHEMANSNTYLVILILPSPIINCNALGGVTLKCYPEIFLFWNLITFVILYRGIHNLNSVPQIPPS